MAGPCMMDGDCTEFYMDGDNLRVDLVIDPSTNNAATCGVAGLFVQKHRMRFVIGYSNTVIPGVDGLSQNIAGPRIDLVDWQAGAPGLAGANRNITNTETITYQNTTNIPEFARFEMELGPSIFYQRAGWDLQVGLKTSWFGPADLAPISSLYTSVGLATGGSAFDLAWDGSSYGDPVGTRHPPMTVSRDCTIAPGETLTLQWRIFAQYLAEGLPDTTGYIDQSINVIFGSTARIYAWSKG